MCGFVGWLDKAPADRSILERMTTTLTHRGPDAAGYHLEGPIALGHRRLAVIDLAASQQPMHSACGRYSLAYNGELYNFKTLRAELQAKGVQFRTNGDTEVLLQSLIAWGDGALPKLEGMFAFAFWDKQTESLLLARDPLGIKPLNIYQDGQRILFASELKAILAQAGIPVLANDTHIVPAMVGDPVLAKRASDILLEEYGMYVQPINYPTVRKGTERLRITPTPFHSQAMMEGLRDALVEIFARLGIHYPADVAVASGLRLVA